MIIGNWKLNDSILNDEVVNFKMKVTCEEVVEYFDENNPSWYDYFINKARRLLIFESIRMKKKNEKYIDEISQELQECYEEDENNKNEETELRINFLKNEITKYYENKKIYNTYSNIFSENNNNYNLDEYVFKINPINDEKLIEK